MECNEGKRDAPEKESYPTPDEPCMVTEPLAEHADPAELQNRNVELFEDALRIKRGYPRLFLTLNIIFLLMLAASGTFTWPVDKRTSWQIPDEVSPVMVVISAIGLIGLLINGAINVICERQARIRFKRILQDNCP
jgi:hypothetical protein